MKSQRGSFRMPKHEELSQPNTKDAFRSARKPGGEALCPRCGSVYKRGRWSAGPAPRNPRLLHCPACRRTREQLPAGYVNLSGQFLSGHREEIVGLMRRCEAAERSRHPLERIMAIEDSAGGVQVTTTGTHLAQRIGHALRSAYRGAVSMRYGGGETLLRVSWRR